MALAELALFHWTPRRSEITMSTHTDAGFNSDFMFFELSLTSVYHWTLHRPNKQHARPQSWVRHRLDLWKCKLHFGIVAISEECLYTSNGYLANIFGNVCRYEPIITASFTNKFNLTQPGSSPNYMTSDHLLSPPWLNLLILGGENSAWGSLWIG